MEEVERDPKTKKVHWVRIQYFKNGEMLHDVIFAPAIRAGEMWVMVAERKVGSYIPKNRYRPMAVKAAAIIYEFGKQISPAEQLILPFKKPS